MQVNTLFIITNKINTVKSVYSYYSIVDWCCKGYNI
jgi:hypothetical protein